MKGPVGMARQAPLLGTVHLRGPVYPWAIHTDRAQPGREGTGYLSWGWAGVGYYVPEGHNCIVSRTHASHEGGLQETVCTHTKVLRPVHTYARPQGRAFLYLCVQSCMCGSVFLGQWSGRLQTLLSAHVSLPHLPPIAQIHPCMHVLSAQQGTSGPLPHHHKPRPVSHSQTHPVGQQLLVTLQQESRPGNGSHDSAHSSTSEISSSLNPKGQRIRRGGRDHRRPPFGSEVILKNVLILTAWGSPCHSPDQ